MALTDFGYAPELIVRRLETLLTADIGGGVLRINDTLATVDTEFNATWTDTVTTPAVDAVLRYAPDLQMKTGGVHVHLDTSTDQTVPGGAWKEQPISSVRTRIALSFKVRKIRDASLLSRRYSAALHRIIGAYAAGLLSTTDGIEGIFGIGEPTTSTLFRAKDMATMVIMEFTAKVQVYGND